jgi:flagellar hook-length control protein FliK
MIMQPVNVLPTFVSQDTDSKTKESSKSSNKDADFASLVDTHVDNENRKTAEKEPIPVTNAEVATKRNVVAANDDTSNENKVSQESDVKAEASVNKTKEDNKGSKDSEFNRQAAEILAKESEKPKGNAVNDEALAESEQFISLLFSSDQTLANSSGEGKKAGQNNQSGSNQAGNNKATDPNSNTKIDTGASKQDNTISAGEILTGEKNNSEQPTDHKLKAFSKDELLARAQLKNSNAVAQESSSQVLKDYQLSLQSKQDVQSGKSIISEQLASSQLASMQLNSNGKSEVPIALQSSNKDLLKEQVDNGIYKLPVEPIGKDKSTLKSEGNELSPLAKGSAVKADITHSESTVDSSTDSQGDNNTQVEVQKSEKLDNAITKSTGNTADSLANKATVSDVNNEVKNVVINDIANSASGKANADKISAELASQMASIKDSVPQEQPASSKAKQPTVMTSQVQALQQEQSKAANTDLDDSEGAESAYVDSMSPSQEIPKESGLNVTAKVSDSTVMRSASEIQNQAVQANQAKQSDDAYIDHQSSEVLNHTVATDTAQIQKNNVQLQQETISIFKKDFADAVKDKVMIMINQKLQQFDITLDPPEFGNMQIRVNLQGEQAAVNFIVQNQQAKEALEQNMHKLKEMLAEQGVDVGGANVEQQDQQKSNEDDASTKEGNNSSRLANQEEDEHNVEHVLSAKLFDSSATGVDYYA